MKKLTLNEINFALKDIKETLAIWRDDKELDDPYILKLYREFDKLIVMIDAGMIDDCNVVTMCLSYMSEDEIEDMMDANELTERFFEDNI